MTNTSPPVDFKPSEVDLFRSFPPLCATFAKSEAEFTAAMMVRVLVARGDTWRPVKWEEIRETVLADLDAVADGKDSADPLSRLVFEMVSNPFLRPDFPRLARDGYITLTGEPQIAEFTPKGLEQLRTWVRRS